MGKNNSSEKAQFNTRSLWCQWYRNWNRYILGLFFFFFLTIFFLNIVFSIMSILKCDTISNYAI
jgi:hypothetical protein